ncbi:Wzz/FepE/Etk N-terminal domain-containing protein [Leifsonia sp. NPDC080035]|uniref:Wzz/FepE/Etk N-terminal domain-containing protein n=1 Tax=Leifsonia sp. NPDC080035 TaxID=3143936 RepID=A0AAU7GEJ2_9MICO
MDLGGYLKVFRERWLAIALCLLLGIGTAAAVTVSTAPTYQANALLFLKVTSDSGSLFDRSQFSVQRVKSYPDLVDSPDVLRPVISDLHLDTTPEALATSVSATNPIDTVALRVTALSADAKQAAAIANAVSSELSQEVARLEAASSSAKASSSVQLVLTVPAVTPSKPLSPNRTLNLVIGAASGLAAGLILAILLSLADRRLRTSADVRKIGGLPLVGQLPRRKRGWEGLLRRPRAGDAVSAYSEVLTNIGLLSAGRLPRILTLIPAGGHGAAKDSRVQLAVAAESSGRKTLVLEADVASARSLPADARLSEVGLATVLDGEASLADAIVDSTSGTAILPVGRHSRLPMRDAVATRISGILSELEESFALIVMQSTHGARPIDIELATQDADTVVLVTEYAKTRPSDVSRLLAQLELSNVRPLGVLMTGVPRWRRIVVAQTWLPNDARTRHKKSRLRTVAHTDRQPSDFPGTQNQESLA